VNEGIQRVRWKNSFSELVSSFSLTEKLAAENGNHDEHS